MDYEIIHQPEQHLFKTEVDRSYRLCTISPLR